MRFKVGVIGWPSCSQTTYTSRPVDQQTMVAHLAMEGGDNELGRVCLIVRLAAEHARHGGAVLRVERGIDLIKQVEGRRVAALDGKDERQGHQRLLPAAQLLHHQILTRPERHLLTASA